MRTKANKNTCYGSIVLNYLTFKIPYAFRKFNLLFRGKISRIIKRGVKYIYIYGMFEKYG